jgi:hypothetical protein
MATEDKENSLSLTQANLDDTKFELEKWKLGEEIKLKRWQTEEDIKLRKQQLEEDAKLKRDELEVRQKELSKSVWSSPLLLAVIGLFATIIATLVQNYFQSQASRDLERQKFESVLIQKALETPDHDAAAGQLQFLLNLGFIRDETGRIASYISDPKSIPIQPLNDDAPKGDSFQGTDRKVAKLSVGSEPLESFKDLKDLIDSLPPDSAMLSHNPPIAKGADSGRVKEEQRNVRVSAFLYAISREQDNDFHLIIGRAQDAQPEMYMSMEVSGLPPTASQSFQELKAARDALKKIYHDLFNTDLPGLGYQFPDPPIPVEIEGSLFFDIAQGNGQKPGPKSLKDKMPTLWEVHPITKITFKQ